MTTLPLFSRRPPALLGFSLAILALCLLAVLLPMLGALQASAAEAPDVAGLLPLGENSPRPWSFSPAWFALPALMAPLLCWLGCAGWQTLAGDPGRQRRRGIRQLRRVLRETGTPTHARLRRWFAATAASWDVADAAPGSRDIANAVLAISGDPACAEEWRQLWQISERSLFSADTRVPSDWQERAMRAAGRIVPPPRERLFPNRLGDWLPPLAVLILSVASLIPMATRAADGDAAAADARARAQSALKAHWGDWAAHQNLAILDQQAQRWNASLAQSTIALLQHPATPGARATLAAALGEVASADRKLWQLYDGAWYQRIPTLLSVARWQHLGLAAALIGSAGLCCLVLSLYAPARRSTLIATGASGAALGLVLVLTAALCWYAYGDLRKPEAGIVVLDVNLQPAPTALIPEEETSPLAAGTVVVSEGRFLGWRKIRVGREFSGWVRDNVVVPVYDGGLAPAADGF